MIEPDELPARRRRRLVKNQQSGIGNAEGAVQIFAEHDGIALKLASVTIQTLGEYLPFVGVQEYPRRYIRHSIEAVRLKCNEAGGLCIGVKR